MKICRYWGWRDYWDEGFERGGLGLIIVHWIDFQAGQLSYRGLNQEVGHHTTSSPAWGDLPSDDWLTLRVTIPETDHQFSSRINILLMLPSLYLSTYDFTLPKFIFYHSTVYQYKRKYQPKAPYKSFMQPDSTTQTEPP